MAEGADDEDKTEEPSPKKLREAREKGQVVQSKEINTWVILFTTTLLLAWLSASTAERLVEILKDFVERPHSFSMDGASIVKLMASLAVELLKLIGPIMLAFFLAAGLSSFAQVGPLISTQSLEPSLDKVNPLKGFKKVFGQRAWIEFIKAFLKMILVGVITTIILVPIFDKAPGMVGIYPHRMMEILLDETNQLLIAVLSILFVFAILDYGVQRYQMMKQLRMSRQELKDEYKQTEGDPHIKARLRELRMQRSRKRMMTKVPDATVIITNPTHYAIALEYDTKKSGAPIVVAKGLDRIALKIRELATENNVPIVENRPLARAMYETAELDQEIPEEHFKAVAEIISYVYSLKKR